MHGLLLFVLMNWNHWTELAVAVHFSSVTAKWTELQSFYCRLVP